MRRTTILTALTLFAVLLLAGCERVTRENYEKIRTGMTMDEVVKILGEPTDQQSVGIGPLEATTARWEGKSGAISIQFVGKKVQIKRFIAGGEKDDAKVPES